MHSSSPSEVKLKSDVFDTLLKVFDLDPRTRAGFREVGGFVYVMSVLINMEGSLADPISAVWKNGKDLFGLGVLTFNGDGIVGIEGLVLNGFITRDEPF